MEVTEQQRLLRSSTECVDAYGILLFSLVDLNYSSYLKLHFLNNPNKMKNIITHLVRTFPPTPFFLCVMYIVRDGQNSLLLTWVIRSNGRCLRLRRAVESGGASGFRRCWFVQRGVFSGWQIRSRSFDTSRSDTVGRSGQRGVWEQWQIRSREVLAQTDPITGHGFCWLHGDIEFMMRLVKGVTEDWCADLLRPDWWHGLGEAITWSSWLWFQWVLVIARIDNRRSWRFYGVLLLLGVDVPMAV